MTNVIEHVLNYEGMSVYYETTGNPNGEALVMLHPAFTDHRIYKEQIDAFGKEYELFLIDMVGHGKSQGGNSKVTLAHMPQIIREILVQHNRTKANVIGVSLGSLVAQGFAMTYPESVLSVTIVGGYSIHKDNADILKEQNKERWKWLLYIVFSMKNFRDYVTRMSVETEEGRTLFRAGTEYFKRCSFRPMQGIDKLMVPKPDPVDYPMLIICGDHDFEMTKEASKRLEKSETNARYVEIQNAGHCANCDNPEVFNRTVLEFLAIKK